MTKNALELNTMEHSTRRTSISLYILGPLFFLLTAADTIAQVRPGGGMMEHDGKNRNAIILDLALPMNDAKDYFQDYMNERYDAKVKGLGFLQNRAVLSVERAEIPALHSKAMDLFIRFEEENEDATQVLLIGRDGYDLYFGKDYAPETHERLMELMRNFKVHALETHYKGLLAQQQDDLKELERAQEKMTRRVRRDRSEQEDNRERNKDLDEEIEELEKKKKEAVQSMEVLREDIIRSRSELPTKK